MDSARIEDQRRKISQRLNRFQDLMAEIDAAESITKSLHNEAKSALGRAWEERKSFVFERALAMPESSLRDALLRWHMDSSCVLAHANGVMKKLDKSLVEHGVSDEGRDGYDLVLSLKEDAEFYLAQLERVKATAAKIRTPQQVREQKEAERESALPAATKEQRGIAQNAIGALMAEFRPALLEMIERQLLGQKARIDDQLAELDKVESRDSASYRQLRESSGWQCLASLYDTAGSLGRFYRPGDIMLADDWQARLRALAIREADELAAAFSHKQVSKLASLVTAKNPIARVDGRVTTGSGALEANLTVELEQGDSFCMRTQVVSSFSKYGRLFHRYPTTFHDLVQRGTLIQKGLSEAEMRNVFCGGQDACHAITNGR